MALKKETGCCSPLQLGKLSLKIRVQHLDSRMSSSLSLMGPILRSVVLHASSPAAVMLHTKIAVGLDVTFLVQHIDYCKNFRA
jgi:hypothetical protein